MDLEEPDKGYGFIIDKLFGFGCFDLDFGAFNRPTFCCTSRLVNEHHVFLFRRYLCWFALHNLCAAQGEREADAL